MTREAVGPLGDPPHMSQAVRVDRTVYVSGQVALDAAGAIVGPGDVAVQARACFASIDRLLAGFGGGLADVAKITAFIARPDLLGAYLRVRQEVFTSDPPASSTVVAGAAVPGLLIEIEAVAVLPDGA